jgi:hypothetical protein
MFGPIVPILSIVAVIAAAILLMKMLSARRKHEAELLQVGRDLGREVAQHLISGDPFLKSMIHTRLDVEQFGWGRWWRIVYTLIYDGDEEGFSEVEQIAREKIVEFVGRTKKLVRFCPARKN